MRILVSSNCQTSGITGSLRILLPDHQVDPFPYPEMPIDEHHPLVAELERSDVWVVSAGADFLESTLRNTRTAKLRILTIPEVYFDAFHPDLVYAFVEDRNTLEGATGPYNSAIALWAWRKGLTPEDAQNLFNPQIFDRLGYTARWIPPVERLTQLFEPHPHLNAKKFIMDIQLDGTFMHSVNHPKITVLAHLARQIARSLGATNGVLSEPIEDFLVDGLLGAGYVWPVYPHIANRFGSNGSYTWKLLDQSVLRLEEYLVDSFEKYDAIGIRDFNCRQLEWPQYDRVLGAMTSATKL